MFLTSQASENTHLKCWTHKELILIKEFIHNIAYVVEPLLYLFNWWLFSVHNYQEANEQASAASSLGAEYISRHVARVQDPFELAISTYALVVKNRDDKITSLNRLNDMKRNSRCSIQLTRYGLNTYIIVYEFKCCQSVGAVLLLRFLCLNVKQTLLHPTSDFVR